MTVPSYEFLAFAAIAALVINVSSNPRWRQAVLLVANLAFLATFVGAPVQIVPYAGLLALGFASMKLLEKDKRKALFIVLMAALLLAFFWLKRYVFVPHQAFLQFVYVTIGMSYVFFRILHVVIDSFQDALPRRVGAVSYLNFTLNFTSLVSGPIQFFKDYDRDETERPASLNAAVAAGAVERIVMGFFKVSVVSTLLLAAHGRAMGALETPGHEAGWLYAALALAIYPFYIYFNFSGYTDFVIGVARFLRLELPENFNKPFYAESFIDFWGRWHMTLSNWLKTYVYSPLLISLMRRYRSPKIEPLLGVFAYFVTFFLIGAWHGQTSMFLFYGTLLGLGVSINKLYQIGMIKRLGRAAYRKLCANPLYAALSRGLTFLYFAFSLLWFWSSWAQLGHLATLLGALALLATGLLVWLGAALVLWAGKTLDERLGGAMAAGQAPRRRAYARTAWATAMAVILLSVTVVLNAPAPHVIYRAF